MRERGGRKHGLCYVSDECAYHVALFERGFIARRGRSRARIMTGLDGQKGTAFIIVRYVLEPGRRPSERVYDFRRAEIGCSIALVENYGFMKV